MKSTCSVCWILVALLLIVIAANVQANVIINKEYSPEEHIVKGKPVTVTVRIYNMGSEDLTSVYVDEGLADNKTAWAIVSGSGTGKIESIPPNSNATHSYTLMPKIAGEVKDKPALIRFKTSSSASKIKVAQSASRGLLLVLTEQQYNAKYAKHPIDWAVFTGIAASTVFIPWWTWQSILTGGGGSVSSSKKKK